jgi:MFS family permease
VGLHRGMGIVAYRDGGATAVGLVGLLRMVPSAVLAPLAAPLADRVRRERVLVLVSTVRGLATAAAAIVVGAGGPVTIVLSPRCRFHHCGNPLSAGAFRVASVTVLVWP